MTNKHSTVQTTQFRVKRYYITMTQELQLKDDDDDDECLPSGPQWQEKDGASSWRQRQPGDSDQRRTRKTWSDGLGAGQWHTLQTAPYLLQTYLYASCVLIHINVYSYIILHMTFFHTIFFVWVLEVNPFFIPDLSSDQRRRGIVRVSCHQLKRRSFSRWIDSPGRVHWWHHQERWNAITTQPIM